MLTRAELKQNAKASLKNLWGESIKIILVYFGISFLVGFINGFVSGILGINANDISNILSIIVNSLLMFGFVNFFLKVSRNEKVTYKELFAKKDMWLKYIVSSLLIGLIVLLGTVLLVIPGIIAMLALSQTMYILLDNPEMKVTEAMKKSNEMMKGHKFDYFVLGLSFIGWAILCVFTLGIGFLWLAPYMSVTTSNFYNNLLETNK